MKSSDLGLWKRYRGITKGLVHERTIMAFLDGGKLVFKSHMMPRLRLIDTCKRFARWARTEVK